MSLSLTRVDDCSAGTPPTVRRPISLGVQVLEDAKVDERKVTKTNALTTRISEATPPIETQGVGVSNAAIVPPASFKQPEHVDIACSVVLRDPPRNHRVRPRSVTLTENPSVKTRGATPRTPTLDSSHTVPSGLDMFLTYGNQVKSRSLEDMLHMPDSITIGQSTASVSSTGSHSSLHGSLEVIKVS